MKNLQHIFFLISMIVGTIIVNAQNTNMNMLILAPQNHDVIYVNQTTTSIPLLLSVSQKIDSTSYEISLGNHNPFSKRYTQKFWSVEDPHTLDIPVYPHQNISIQVTTYYQGQIQKTEKVEISFKQMATQFGYVHD